jgi:tetratricopeptide (TPR) repeat protein
MLVSLCRAAPEAYDYASAFRELEKLHRKRDSAGALARVLVAQASLLELAYDVEAAEQGYLSAVRLAPSDFTVVEPLVSLNERLRRFEGGEALIEAFLERATELSARSAARLRLAMLRGEAMMDSDGAAGALRELLDEDPNHKEALFLYAQELYLLGRYAEARRAAERLVEVATSPEHTAPPEELARYYDYLGRILEAAGDVQGAGRSYRRAVDLDPTYPPACLALARRAAATGDLVQGTRVLADALEAAEQGGNVEAALTLQRSRARFLVNWGELALAAQAFRALLDRETDAMHTPHAPHAPYAPHAIEDRLAYADLLGRSEQTISMSFGEIERVLTHSPRESQAYRQLAQLYVRVGQPARAVRVYTLMSLMGILEGGDRPPAVAPTPRRGALNDELRGQYTGPDVRGVLTEALVAVRESLEEAYPFVVPTDAIPLAQIGDPSLRATVQDLERVFGVSAEVFISPSLTVSFSVNDLPKPVIYLSQAAAQLSEPERRVLLGYALEALRGGYALITRIGGGARLEVTNLIDQLVRPEGERSAEAQGYIKALPRKAQKALEKLWGVKSKSTLPPVLGGAPSAAPARLQTVPVDQWLDEVERSMRRAGLVASDDLGACARMHLRAGHAKGDLTQTEATQLGASAPVAVTTSVVQLVDDLDLVGEAVLAIDRGSGLADLVSFYLSEPYHLLRSAIGDAA